MVNMNIADRNITAEPRAGFTLIEMLVVIAIMGIMTLVVLANQGPLKANLALRAESDKIIAAFREAQVKAFAVYESSGRFDIGYGVNVSKVSGDYAIRLFADRPGAGEGKMDSGEGFPETEVVRGVSIKKISAENCYGGDPNIKGANAVFKRPRPVANIVAEAPGGPGTQSGCADLKIVIEYLASGQQLEVKFLPNADISVSRVP